MPRRLSEGPWLLVAVEVLGMPSSLLCTIPSELCVLLLAQGKLSTLKRISAQVPCSICLEDFSTIPLTCVFTDLQATSVPNESTAIIHQCIHTCRLGPVFPSVAST